MMTFYEIAQKLKIENYPVEMDDIYEKLSGKNPVACDLNLLDQLQEQYDLFGEYFDRVKKAAEVLNQDAIRSAWIAVAAHFAMSGDVEQACKVPVPSTDGTLEGDFLPLYILLPQIPKSIADYKARGFSAEAVMDILKEYKLSIGIVKSQTGRPGIDKTYYDWLSIFAKAQIFCLMGLQFELFKLPEQALWLRNKSTKQIVPLMLSGTFHASGIQRLGSKGYDDTTGSFVPSFSEDTQHYYGHGVYNSVVSAHCESFSKNDWECVGRPGEICLNIHVPRGSDISRETVLTACREAIKLAAIRYPEATGIRLVLGISWLLNPKLKQIQGENAKTTQFMECFTKYPRKDMYGTSVFSFVFGRQYEDLTELPENTSLQRKLKALYLNGGCLHNYIGAIFIERE